VTANLDGDGTQRGQLGFWMCTALVVGNTIGIGIFMQPASLAPFGANAFLAWGITVAGCALLAVVFATLARRLPEADGPFGYMRATIGDGAAFAALWCYWISLWVSNAAIAVGVVGYLDAVIPAIGQVPPALAASVLIWIFIAVNLLGARTGGEVQVVTSALKLAPMLLVMVLGAWTLLTEPGAYDGHMAATPVTFPATLAASTIALFAMLGLESATVPASQVRDPERTIPRATLAGTLLTAAIYMAVTAIALRLVPHQVLEASGAPFVDVLERLLGAGTGRWLALFVVISGVGALNGWTLLVGELTRTLASNGTLPTVLARSNARGAPALALVFTGVLATAVALMNYSKSLVEGFTFLSIVVTAANLPLYVGCAAALVLLWRRDRRSLPRLAWVAGLGGLLYSVYAFVGVGLEPFLWAVALALAGLPLYWWYRRSKDQSPRVPAP
jgi:APA family basic amino acid/polyamine antiporter